MLSSDVGRWAAFPSTRQASLVFALGASVFVLALGAPSSAFARLSWTGPVGQDTAGNGPALIAVACPSTTECVAIDVNGGEETFNPSAPAPNAPVSIDSSEPLSVACLSVTSCVAVDVAGREVTFNPQAPAASAQAMTVDAGQVLTSVSCPPGQATTCTAVDAVGNAVTFNAATGAHVASHQIDPGNVLTSLSCAVQNGCVAVDDIGTAFTFDPQTGQPEGSQSLESHTYLTTVTCTLTSTRCVAFDSNGTELEFYPAGVSASVSTIPSFDTGHSIAAVACPDGANCAVIDADGGEISFTPSATGGNSAQRGRAVISPTYQPTSLACPSAHLCVAVDAAGHEISFDPTANPPVPASARVDGLPSYAIVSCPAATQCTGIDAQGNEATFNPTGAGALSSQAAVDPNGITMYSISCPSPAQCTTVDERGQEVTFNPASPGAPAPVAIVNDHPLLAVSCPSATQCTAVDDDQYEATFNPQQPTSGRYAALGTPSGVSLTGVSCPSVSQCTAVDAVGDAVSFNPQAPGSPKPTQILLNPAIGVSCPTTSRCVALDSSGIRATFDPANPSAATMAPVDSAQPSQLSCPSATFCLAIDANNNAVEFDPDGTGATAARGVGSTGSVNGLACASVGECVVVDSIGRAFVGTGPVPRAPAATSAPAISGLAKEGRTLGEIHAAWSGPPTSYTYQWERCTTQTACVPIGGATQQTYRLVAADVGRLIRVTEQAADAGGFGPTVVSAATRKVLKAPQPPDFSHVSLTGVAAGHPRLIMTLTAARYGPTFKRLTLSVAKGLSLHRRLTGPRKHRRWVGLTVTVHAKHVKFSARISHGALTIVFSRAVSAVKLGLARAALGANHSLQLRVRRHQVRKLKLTVAIPNPGHAALRGSDEAKVS
jgi:hypothetical protein